MKGKRIHPKIRDRAQVLYTMEGCPPEEVIERLSQELFDLQLDIAGMSPEDIELPKDRSTINGWSKKYAWTPHWTEARKRHREAIEAGEPFAISGITDPVWHLSRVKGLRFCRDYTSQHPGFSARHILQQCTLFLNEEIQPGPGVFRYLAPILRAEIQEIKKAHGIMEEPMAMRARDAEGNVKPPETFNFIDDTETEEQS